MSAPDQVQVDHPGAGGGGPGLSGNSNSSAGSGAESSMGSHHDVSPSTPWTVGSTEGVSTITVPIPATQISLADQTGASQEMPSPPPQFRGGATIGSGGEATATTLQSLTSGSWSGSSKKSSYQDTLCHQPSAAVEAVLSASCEAMGFDIAEMWLRTGPRSHQLTNSHLRPTSLEDSVRNELVDVYYGERSSERTHRLSPALCKRAKEAMDVVWVTAHTQHGAEALRLSISDVRTAVAIPVCHAASNTNLTVIFFSIRR